MTFSKVFGLLGGLWVATYLVIQADLSTRPSPRFVNESSVLTVALARAAAPSLDRAGITLPFEQPGVPKPYILYHAGVITAMLLFLAGWLVLTHRQRLQPSARDQAVLAGLLLCALLGNDTLTFALVLAIGAMADRRTALQWLALVMVASLANRAYFLLGLDGVQHFSNIRSSSYNAVTNVVMQILAFLVGRLIAAERRGRAELARSNATLEATQQLLAATVRGSERLRISRNLHDALGHHLTALNLHLELAQCQTGDSSRASVATAHGIARSLMSEVRTVVSAERSDAAIDVRAALAPLCEGWPDLQVDLACPEALRLHSASLAQDVFHIVQEAVTNTVRHAGASRLSITLDEADGQLVLQIHDNGKGMGRAQPGNGLRGMRERVEALGGKVAQTAPPGGGYGFIVTIPQGRA